MQTIELLGEVVEVDEERTRSAEVSAMAVECRGDACGDIDYQWNESTRSYHFFNDGGRRVRLKVWSASVYGCGGSRTRNMRAGDEWDTGFFGVCKYEANYR